MLRTYSPVGFNQWVCENQPGEGAMFSKGWWDAVEFVRFLEHEFAAREVTIVGDFDMCTPPPSEILQMPIFCLRLDGLALCLKNDFSALEPYWAASVLIGDDRGFSAFGLVAPLDRWRRDLRDAFPSDWQFPEYTPESRRFSCGLQHEHAVYSFLWLLTHRPNSPYHDQWEAEPDVK